MTSGTSELVSAFGDFGFGWITGTCHRSTSFENGLLTFGSLVIVYCYPKVITL